METSTYNQLNKRDYILKAVGVNRVFGSGDSAVHALKHVDVSITQGRLVCLKGRSGSGKTTLINLFGALDKPTQGLVFFGEKEISSLSDKQRSLFRQIEIGLIFQSIALIPFMSAYENVEFALRIAGIHATERKKLAEEALTFVGLRNRMKHRPSELSGGEQQRVAIARAIAHKPKLILADEPTAELDVKMGLQIMKVFRDLVEKVGISIVMSTHDPAIMEIVDDVYELKDGMIVEHIINN